VAATAPPPARSSTPLRRVLALAAGLLGLVLVAQGALTLLDLLAREDTTTTRPLGSVRSLVVDSDSGTVVVRAVPGAPQVRTELTRGLFGGSADVAVTGGRVQVRTDCPALGSVTCSARHEVRVPPGTRVQVRTGSGEVVLAGAAGTATLRTGSGSIEVESVGGGTLDARTGSGSIAVRGARSDTVRLETGSGEIEAGGLTAPDITARTGSGSVDLEALAPPRTLTARTGSGEVNLLVPDVAYAVTADTGSGDEDIDVAQDPDARRRLTLQTGSGDVSVLPRPSARR
jgi:hypothetical protein